MPNKGIGGLVCLLLFSATSAKAQTVRVDTLAAANILVYADSRYELLVRKQAEYNEKVNLTRKYSHGFRIQVLNTTDRAQAITTKTRLLQLFPEEKVYLLYQEPYFKVRIGNFRQRGDADEELQQIGKQFPGVFVIPSPIEPKPEWLKESASESPM
jgi:SPOR domain